MEFMDTLLQRRSVRTYTDRSISEETMHQLLEAGLLVPSGKGIWPTQMIVVTDPEVLVKFKEARTVGGFPLENAKAVIVVLGDSEASDTWVEDGSIALTNMQLKAVELGLGTCWVQGKGRTSKVEADGKPLSTEAYLRSFLGFPEKMSLVAMLAVGYPDKEVPPHTTDEANFAKIHYNHF